jgi:hypothetical protein
MRPVCSAALAWVCLAFISFSVVLGASNAGASDSTINVVHSFDPPKAAYCPGENFTIRMTVVNMLPSGDYVYDDLAYMQKVTNLSVHFSWMAPNEYAWNDVSNESEWLLPDGLGSEIYLLNTSVPADVPCTTYSYYFRVEYLTHTPWGNLTGVWGTGDTYRDFVVSTESDAGGEGIGTVDITPYIAFAAIVLSLGSVAAVMYHRQTRGGPGHRAATLGAPVAGQRDAFPVIRPLPGEHFPVERGFVYLVKEKRPRVAFDMFNEAVKHDAKGMLVVREHPNRLRHSHSFEAEKILWLTRRTGVDHIDPTELSLLNLKITKFVESMKKAVVLIEGVEYMITQNDFESVLRFVNHMHDFVLTHDCAVILVIDERVLSTREIALLERATKIIEPFDDQESSSGDGSLGAEA